MAAANVQEMREPEHCDVIEKYLWNGNKSKIVASGLLNTSALSSNASLLAILLKNENTDIFKTTSIILIIASVCLQIITGMLLLLEYRSTLTCERDKNRLSRTPRSAEDQPDGLTEKLLCWASPMEYQFWSMFCLMLLNVVNSFIIAFASKADTQIGP